MRSRQTRAVLLVGAAAAVSVVLAAAATQTTTSTVEVSQETTTTSERATDTSRKSTTSTSTTIDPLVEEWYRVAGERAWYESIPTTTTTTTSRRAPVEHSSGGGTGNGFLECVKQRESGGNYGISDPSYQWHGAYQFGQQPWNATAEHIGRYDLVGVNPASASPADQDLMAQALYEWQGTRPWYHPSNSC